MIVFCRHIPRSVLSGSNIVSPPNTERDRSPSTETVSFFYIPICTIRYHSLVKLIKHTRCNNCDRIFQFLKFPPIFKYKNRSKRFNTKTQFQFPDHSNPDRIHARYCANNPLSPSSLLPSKGTKISLYLDQFKPLSRDIRSSLRNNERRRVENVETGKNGGFGGRGR